MIGSQRDETYNDRKFSHTDTYKIAKNILNKGYSDPLKEMKNEILKIGRNDKTKKAKFKNDFVGFIPHVPNTLMNIPQTMINKDRTKKKSKTMTIYYNFCDSGNISPKTLYKGGINFISLVNMLEKQGYRIKINVMFTINN